MKKMMTVLLAVVFTFSILFTISSCAKKQIGAGGEGMAPPPPARGEGPGGPAGGPGGEMKPGGPPARPPMDDKLQKEIQAFESEHIYFDFDKAELKPAARAVLNKKAAWLKANPNFSIRIEGHCDERGTNEYNLALGERRANSAWKFLNALGISGDRMDNISYGEERPAVMGHDESAWSKNRRDEFKLIK